MRIKRFFKSIIPPPRWRFPVIVVLGILVGLGILTLRVSQFTSYLSDNPEACINCHVMTPQFASWKKSSHKNVATCNDCHVPNDNFVSKYLFKAQDGLQHSYVFTFRLEPQVIRIDEAGIETVQENCIRCHNKMINTTELITISGEMGIHGKGKLCWDCHREIPHGKVSSLSSFPNAYRPDYEDPMPDWIRNFLKEESNKNNK